MRQTRYERGDTMRGVRSQRRGGGSTAEELAVIRAVQGEIKGPAPHSRAAAPGRPRQTGGLLSSALGT